MTDAAINVRSLSARLGGRELLHDLSFQVGKGEFFSLIGPNGAGKSTLLRCLVRIVAHQGAVEVCGRPLHQLSGRKLARLVSYVPQHEPDVSHFTVLQFVLMARFARLRPLRGPSDSDRRVAEEALEDAGIEPLAERTVSTLSGGERRKVSIAAGIAQRPQVLLVDEPTTFLDPLHQVEVMSLLRRLNERHGVTILAVTHDVNAALEGADRIAALKRGRLAFCGTPRSLSSDGVLESIYGLPFTRLPHPGVPAGFMVPRLR